MKKIITYTAAVAMVSMALTASAAAPVTAPGQNKLQCFDGTTDGGFGGICTVSNGAKGSATLDNTDTNPNGDYAGVYIENSTLLGQTLSNVTQLSYNYTGTVSPLPGDMSLNVPIDITGDSATDGYAFVDAYYCPGVGGFVDVINDPNCGIWFLGTEYANWAALAAAYPAATVSDIAFVIAERTPSEPAALWTVNNVKLGKAGKKSIYRQTKSRP